jgi:hypothetical protein
VSGLSSRPDCSEPAIVQLTRQFHYTATLIQIPRLLLCSTRPTIPRITVREAKDFLVGQAAQQAAIDGVPFADLEKRMMYFTDWDDSGGDPIALNEEFEAHYNTEEYESKNRRAYATRSRSPKKREPLLGPYLGRSCCGTQQRRPLSTRSA